MILTMIARHYTEKEAMEMLPGLTSYMYQKASERVAFLCNPFKSNCGTGICDKIWNTFYSKSFLRMAIF